MGETTWNAIPHGQVLPGLRGRESATPTTRRNGSAGCSGRCAQSSARLDWSVSVIAILSFTHKSALTAILTGNSLSGSCQSPSLKNTRLLTGVVEVLQFQKNLVLPCQQAGKLKLLLIMLPGNLPALAIVDREVYSVSMNTSVSRGPRSGCSDSRNSTSNCPATTTSRIVISGVPVQPMSRTIAAFMAS